MRNKSIDDLLQKVTQLKKDIESSQAPNSLLLDQSQEILLACKKISFVRGKTVLAQQIEHVLNKLTKTEKPSLEKQKEMIEEVLEKFHTNFTSST